MDDVVRKEGRHVSGWGHSRRRSSSSKGGGLDLGWDAVL